MTKIAGYGSESGSVSQMHGSPYPDPYQKVMDPQYWFVVVVVIQLVVAVAGCPCARALVLLPRVLVGPVLLLQGT